MSALLTIRCTFPPPATASHSLHGLTGERLLACQAMRLLVRLDTELRYARADFNEDRFRRIMRARPKAVSRLRRRWAKLNPQPAIVLGSLRRRYHTNLTRYLYQTMR
jgi:hypothetical protein